VGIIEFLVYPGGVFPFNFRILFSLPPLPDRHRDTGIEKQGQVPEEQDIYPQASETAASLVRSEEESVE